HVQHARHATDVIPGVRTAVPGQAGIVAVLYFQAGSRRAVTDTHYSPSSVSVGAAACHSSSLLTAMPVASARTAVSAAASWAKVLTPAWASLPADDLPRPAMRVRSSVAASVTSTTGCSGVR